MRHWHDGRTPFISRLVTDVGMSLSRTFSAALLILCGLSAFGPANAQSAPPQSAPTAILADGNAVVTGFSGVQVIGSTLASTNPAARIFIDLDGSAARIVDLQNPGASPQAQMLTARKPFTLTAAQIGQVFGVALDDASPPNVFLAATSVYGLPIVVPTAAGGALQRIGLGSANASFMPGLFGPATLRGGPGSIWRVDGVSGRVSLFANVSLSGVANSGPGLGGLAFDSASGSLFVADRETGLIYAFDRKGAERARFDHGVQGRQAAGLTPVQFDPSKRVDITDPHFNSEDPSTWGYAPPERRVFALAVHAGRLYYSVADGMQVWSVSIGADGSFGSDPRVEVRALPGFPGNEISKVAFDEQGRMVVAERAAPTGASDLVVLTPESAGPVLRFQLAPAAASAAANSTPKIDEYAIGFFKDLRNGTGGAAIGYRYDSTGRLDRSTCGGFLWTTGDELRNAANPALAARLKQGGPPNVDGLQGNGVDLVRPANVPPLQTYFVDYSDSFGGDASRGHVGDVAIRLACGGAPRPASLPSGLQPAGAPSLPGVIPSPGAIVPRTPPAPPLCPPNQLTNAGLCCPLGSAPQSNGSCARPPRCPPGQVTRTGLCCPEGTTPQRNGSCARPPRCPPGQVTRTGLCCPEGTTPQRNGSCSRPPRCPPGQVTRTGLCCPVGTTPQSNGSCAPARLCQLGQLTTTGLCCPAGTAPQRDGSCATVTPPQTTTLVPLLGRRSPRGVAPRRRGRSPIVLTPRQPRKAHIPRAPRQPRKRPTVVNRRTQTPPKGPPRRVQIQNKARVVRAPPRLRFPIFPGRGR